MSLSAEWRVFGEFDALLIMKASGEVKEAITLNVENLHDFLTAMQTVFLTTGDLPISGEKRNPEPWGALVLSRSETGEIIDMDPEKFWEGIHIWFRSHGVDYDSPISHHPMFKR
ncbi:MAG: hypothetical protein FI734_02025 [SAR202 cluster bacterium]|nr:hypothetical protein [SAR202 cluster bacterium]|tara:strand:- start:5328 stop:5669 length:342 start_codon:yes stop_codon:yes gene_type:complete